MPGSNWILRSLRVVLIRKLAEKKRRVHAESSKEYLWNNSGVIPYNGTMLFVFLLV